MTYRVPSVRASGLGAVTTEMPGIGLQRGPGRAGAGQTLAAGRTGGAALEHWSVPVQADRAGGGCALIQTTVRTETRVLVLPDLDTGRVADDGGGTRATARLTPVRAGRGGAVSIKHRRLPVRAERLGPVRAALRLPAPAGRGQRHTAERDNGCSSHCSGVRGGGRGGAI